MGLGRRYTGGFEGIAAPEQFKAVRQAIAVGIGQQRIRSHSELKFIRQRIIVVVEIGC